MFGARVILDSIGVDSQGNQFAPRITTIEACYPRCIHAELMTHRVFSRNSASSRAIPVTKMMRDLTNHPFIPIYWGKNQPGMQAREQIDADSRRKAIEIWMNARDEAMRSAFMLDELGVHKQIVNRLLEPWMFITVIITSTEWANFFLQRCSSDAEPHMEVIARLMRSAIDSSHPRKLSEGGWHLPFVTEHDLAQYSVNDCIKKSVARCARGSYLQQHGDHTIEKDIALHDKLSSLRHWSPFEHQAQAYNPNSHMSIESYSSGNFRRGWAQYRKTFADESGN